VIVAIDVRKICFFSLITQQHLVPTSFWPDFFQKEHPVEIQVTVSRRTKKNKKTLKI